MSGLPIAWHIAKLGFLAASVRNCVFPLSVPSRPATFTWILQFVVLPPHVVLLIVDFDVCPVCVFRQCVPPVVCELLRWVAREARADGSRIDTSASNTCVINLELVESLAGGRGRVAAMLCSDGRCAACPAGRPVCRYRSPNPPFLVMVWYVWCWRV